MIDEGRSNLQNAVKALRWRGGKKKEVGEERAPREVCSFGAGQQEILSPQLAAATDTKQSTAAINSAQSNQWWGKTHFDTSRP